MKKIKSLFNNYDLTLKKVIGLAVLSAIYTAIMCIIPFTKDTSFRDIGINFECWIVLAIFIINNSKSTKKAILYTFLFFLISQPLIYLIQVPFSIEDFNIFRHYGYWFIWTLLTIPGSIIAYQLKRKNLISVFILSVAVAFLGYMAATYARSAIYSFPNHLLSSLFCIVSSIMLCEVLFEKRTHKIIIIIVLIISVISTYVLNSFDESKYIEITSNNATYTIEDEG
ncbi:MAG: hypothetical protein Q4F12_02540, partial [Erysipelotrichaceae bacterium]|nr:hypothetical protein [Erysipelotrichaceae bacterium]